MKLYIFVLGLLLVVFFIVCLGEKKEIMEKEGVEIVFFFLFNEVMVMLLKKQVFNYELISNGKVMVQDYVDLYFCILEVVVNIWVKNGDIVWKG